MSGSHAYVDLYTSLLSIREAIRSSFAFFRSAFLAQQQAAASSMALCTASEACL
jgi:hypothetical protein